MLLVFGVYQVISLMSLAIDLNHWTFEMIQKWIRAMRLSRRVDEFRMDSCILFLAKARKIAKLIREMCQNRHALRQLVLRPSVCRWPINCHTLHICKRANRN